MAKRNAHALQRRYTKLLAMETALTEAVWHLGQVVTGRPPKSLGPGMWNLIRTEYASSATNDCDKLRGVGTGCEAEVAGSESLSSALVDYPLVPLEFTQGGGFESLLPIARGRR